MRDYTNIDQYLNALLGDIYPQPEDPGHTQLAQEVIDHWMSRLGDGVKTVLDVGCGTGFCQPMFERYGVQYQGIALGADVVAAFNANHNVKTMDFSFIDFPDASYDMIFARHAFEHSPMPILTLMEWHRIAKAFLGMVVPAPEHYTFEGKNHYSVMLVPQILTMAERAGWKPIWTDVKNIIISTPAPQPDQPPTVSEHAQEYWIFFERQRRAPYGI